jgi:hypothetical protein
MAVALAVLPPLLSVAVIVATPGLAGGWQTTGLVSESQVPPQTSPGYVLPLATSPIVGLLLE